MKIQVVALQWKWLFLYPEQDIATVNFVQFPEKVPIHFEITADAPMNSFWIPKLGGQIYALSGMATHLHLMADKAGIYQGSSANISGRDFAAMHFVAVSTTKEAFERWIEQIKRQPDRLGWSTYKQLAAPNKNFPSAYYSAVQPDLFNTIVTKFMRPQRAGVGI